MSCCGQRQFVAHSTSPARGAQHAPTGHTAATPTDPVFEYIGATALVVTGPITGRPYRFTHRGARLAVSRHDAPSVMHVPNLRHVATR